MDKTISLEAIALESARTLLFVPGHRPDRFDKAVAAGADAIIIDLEDAVSPEQKVASRKHAQSWLARGGKAVVRINARDKRWFLDDATMAAAASDHPAQGRSGL
jgi:citrate lyase subunit beta/citryl-CoA lyase